MTDLRPESGDPNAPIDRPAGVGPDGQEASEGPRSDAEAPAPDVPEDASRAAAADPTPSDEIESGVKDESPVAEATSTTDDGDAVDDGTAQPPDSVGDEPIPADDHHKVRETTLEVQDLILPLFVRPGRGVKKEISSMPGNYQLSIDRLVEEGQAGRRHHHLDRVDLRQSRDGARNAAQQSTDGFQFQPRGRR